MPNKQTPDGKPKTLTEKRLCAICTLILGLVRHARMDPSQVKTAFGDITMGSLRQVSNKFGLSGGTVGTSWRQNGMPGEPCNYNLADVLTWLIEKELREHGRKKEVVNPHKQERAAAETQIAIYNAQLLGQKVNRNTDLAEFTDEVRAQQRAMLIVLREGIMSIASKCKPFLPRETATDLSERIKSICRLALEGLGSKSQAELEQLYREATARLP